MDGNAQFGGIAELDDRGTYGESEGTDAPPEHNSLLNGLVIETYDEPDGTDVPLDDYAPPRDEDYDLFVVDEEAPGGDLELVPLEPQSTLERDDKWYQLKTALALVQATGRSVRSEDDWAITVILDSAFERFLIQNQDILPEWWKAAIEFK